LEPWSKDRWRDAVSSPWKRRFSSAVRYSSSVGSWNTRPIRPRIFPCSVTTSAPATRACPEVGQCAQHRDRCRLSRAVRSEEAERLSRLNAEAHTPDGLELPIRLGELDRRRLPALRPVSSARQRLLTSASPVGKHRPTQRAQKLGRQASRPIRAQSHQEHPSIGTPPLEAKVQSNR
jgi:hypothetical protein